VNRAIAFLSDATSGAVFSFFAISRQNAEPTKVTCRGGT